MTLACPRNISTQSIKYLQHNFHPWGGGGYSPQILVGMCRGKVKTGQGLPNELPVERENEGFRNELEPF